MTEGQTGPISGFAVLDKPEGVTSFTFLATMARRLGDRVKSGHAGTLDSFASGVLVCLFGRYTRLSNYFMGAGKGYEAEILFGEETDTLDPEGQVVATAPLPQLKELEAILPSFRGTIMQAPPAYSAVHIGGQRAYERARKGLVTSPEPRPVSIDTLELLSFDAGRARIRVACSKGTYIRSLARDIAIACGSRGRLCALRRIYSGPFGVEKAGRPESFGVQDLRTLSIADATGLGLGTLSLEARDARAFLHDIPLYTQPAFSALDRPSPCAVFDASGAPLGIVSRSGNAWNYTFVLGSPV